MARSCTLCGSAEVRKRFTKREIPYFRCDACAFVFSESPENPNFESRLEDYEKSYLDYLESGADDERNFDSVCSWIAGFRELEGARVLDVGCGSGAFVRYLRSRSIDAWGIEPSKALFEHFLAGENGFWSCDLPALSADQPARRFDAITAFDVIEHVERPDLLLRAAANLLDPGGWLFVCTPDVGSVAARALRKLWHYYNKYHLAYFSKVTLSEAAGREGLALMSFSHRSRLRSLGYALAYLLEFVLGRSAPRYPPLLDRIFVPLNLYDNMYLAFRKSHQAD